MAHNFNLEQIPNKNLVGTLLAGAFLTALTVSADRVAVSKRSAKKARLVSKAEDGDRPIYLMPGCRSDGEYIGEMIEPHLRHIGPVRAEAYAEDEFDLEDLEAKELESRARDMGRSAIVYCSSMGGMKFTKSLTKSDYKEKFGHIDTLILDSSPADMEDLDSGTKLAMLAAKIFPPSWTISRLYRSFMRKGAKKLRGHSESVTDEQVRGHLMSSADTPLSAVRSQARFIRETHLSEIDDGVLSDAADKIYYISSAHDHVVNTDAAYEQYNRIFGGKVVRIVDLLRDEDGHADGPEHPELIVQLMEGYQPRTDEPNVAPLFAPEAEPVPILRQTVAA